MKTRLLITLSLLTVGIPTFLNAQTIWTGNTSDDWNTNSNWTASKPGFGATAVFSGTPTTNQPNLNGGNFTGIGLDFQSAGWTINATGGGAIRIDGGTTNLSSAGAGVNTIFGDINSSGNTQMAITVGPDNTLVSNGNWNSGNPKVFSGTGTFVANGTSNSSVQQLITFSDATTLLVNGGFRVINASTVGNGGILGGTGNVTILGFATLTIGNSGVLAPGGNGIYGSEIESLTLQSSSASRAEFVIDNGATARFQIGSGGLGDIDQVVLNLNAGGNLEIKPGATLNLLGSVIQDGTYTLFENTGSSSAIAGTFSSVQFNGAPIDPANFTVNYLSNSITVDVVGIPEPSTVALLVAGSGLALLAKRRKRSEVTIRA